MEHILEGKTLANQIKEHFPKRASFIAKHLGRKARLIGLGWKGDSAGFYYLNKEIESARKIGIDADIVLIDENTTEKNFFLVLDTIFSRQDIDALLIPRPLPPQLNHLDISAHINPKQDIDGAGLISMGHLFMCKTWEQVENLETFIPCCPKAVMRLLDFHKINLAGANVAILGRSNTVGSPLAKMLTIKNATITLCHSKTRNLKDICLSSDIIISATGKAKIINKNFVKKGTILIDVGTNQDEQGKFCGDMAFDELVQDNYISPVPGGVGPVTLACLLENILISAERKI